jgi:DNA-binding CsgD family transcriptional regulator
MQPPAHADRWTNPGGQVISDRQLVALASACYGAAADPAGWPRTFERLADAVGGGGCGFSCGGPAVGCGILEYVRVDPAWVRDCNTYYGSINAWNDAARSSLSDAARMLVLRDLFSLTPKEAHVALLRGEGRTAREIAAVCGTSLSTVRTHAQLVLEKTGSCSQAERSLILFTRRRGAR